MMMSSTVIQFGDARLSLAWIRTGILASARAVMAKTNAPESSKQSGDAGLKAGFQQAAACPAKEEPHPVVPGR